MKNPSLKMMIAVFLLTVTANGFAVSVKIAAIGDSITYGSGIVDRDIYSYPAQLQALLGGDYEVQNFGKSGADVLSINNGPYANTSQHQNALAFGPDIVICNLGINDIGLFENNIAFFVSDYTNLLNQYASLPSQPEIYIWTQLSPVFPGQPNYQLYLDVRADQNAALEQVAANVGAIGLDMYTPLKDHPEWFPDNLHPNADGASVIAQQTFVLLSDDVLNGIDGDVNQDGQVDQLDIDDFVGHWLADTVSLDALERYQHGDMNLNGRTDLTDAYILHEALVANGMNVPMSQLFNSVPEPTTLLLISGGLLAWRRRTT